MPCFFFLDQMAIKSEEQHFTLSKCHIYLRSTHRLVGCSAQKQMADENKDLSERPRDIFLPSSRERRLDYATCEKLQFEKVHLEEENRKNPGLY